MSWGLVATAGASVLSGVMSSNAAGKASDNAAAAASNQLEFDLARYDDWNEVYGSLQSNLSEYYQNVTPDYYAATGLETFETQYQQSLTNLNESFAQRGIDPSSGIAASLESQAELNAAETRASIRREASAQAAEEQSRFLQIGLGQNPANSVSSTLNQQSQTAQQTSLAANQAAGNAWSAAIPAVGTAIDAYNT